MLADIFSTYYRAEPGRQMNRACWFVQRKTLFGWSNVETLWSCETALEEAERYNGGPFTQAKAPLIVRTSGGPMLHMNNGYKHFLLFWERLSWGLGWTDAYRLQKKRKQIMADQPLSDADKIGK
jgi:hypothetical protein